MTFAKVALAMTLTLWAESGVTADVSSTPATPTHTLGTAQGPAYTLQPGDVIDVSVWKETDLQREVLVRPDGGLSFPLAGEISATGMTVDGVRAALTERLKAYLPNPVVTTSNISF